MSKAFDSVNHKMLLTKMKKLNIDPFWFQDYLSNRTQSVRIGGILSSQRDICYGVPQGSILGPVLFIIFINDMGKIAFNCILVLYADDAQFLHSNLVENLQELITSVEETLALAKQYFDRNGLLINTKKTQCIFIGSLQYVARIPNNTTIKYVQN